MAVDEVEITERRALAELPPGVGGYELVRGRVHFVLDPVNPANAAIADLELAADDDGLVRCSSDFVVLEPAGSAPAPLLYVVANRGRAEVLPLAQGAQLPGLLPQPGAPAPSAPAIGDGFVLRLGYRVLWCGWQSDLNPSSGLLCLKAPLATINGESPSGLREVRIELDAEARSVPLIDARALSPAVLPDEVATLDDPLARLVVRPRTGGPFEEIPRERFCFAKSVGGALVPSANDVALAGGFQPENVYVLSFTPAQCPVNGVGLAVARDLVAALRSAPARVLGEGARPVSHALAFGVSQSGRYLRQFLFDGLNLDEAGNAVFDGVFCHIAGARRGDFNERYGQLSSNRDEGVGLRPPYPAVHPSGGLLDRQRELGASPKVLFTNSAFEYWRRDASAIHLELDGSADLPEDDDVRCYLVAGTSHVVGYPAVPPLIGPVNPPSVLDPLPVMRALFVALADWIDDGTPPPDSLVPRVADASASTRAEVLSVLATIPGLGLPPLSMLPVTSRSHPGGEGRIGEGSVAPDDRVVSLVSAIDRDGNERAGVVLPELAAPLYTHVAFNPRAATDGGLVDLIGTSLAFAPDAAARSAAGDPRPSVAERYGGRDDYLAAVRAAGQALVLARLLLAEDMEWVLAAAGQHYDELAGA